MNDIGSRLHYAREKWDLTPEFLATRSGVDVDPIRRIESGDLTPDATTAQRLADALHVYEQWLQDGDIPMAPVWEMTVRTQHEVHNGPGSEGLPGYVVIDPGGPWFLDSDGEWQVDHTTEREA